MRGLTSWSLGLMARRAVTLIPALILLAVGIDATVLLVLSQVALSFGLPFVLIPLVRLTADQRLLGANTNWRLTTVAAWSVTVAIVTLNVILIVGLLVGF